MREGGGYVCTDSHGWESDVMTLDQRPPAHTPVGQSFMMSAIRSGEIGSTAIRIIRAYHPNNHQRVLNQCSSNAIYLWCEWRKSQRDVPLTRTHCTTDRTNIQSTKAAFIISQTKSNVARVVVARAVLARAVVTSLITMICQDIRIAIT